MTYALVLRRLIISGNTYFQVIDKVIGEKENDDLISVVEGDSFVNQALNSIEYDDEIVYFEIEKNYYDRIQINKTFFLKQVNGELQDIPDLTEQNNVIMAFYDTFKDFNVVPDYDILQLANEAKANVSKKVLGQEKIVSRIINKIYSNHMFFDTELDNDEILKNKSNILVMGPMGTGKTSIKNALKKSFSPIPVIEYKLIGNYNQDISEIIRKLVVMSEGNIFLAMRGIVIFDGIDAMSSKFDETGEESVNIYLDTLGEIMKSKMVNLLVQNGNWMSFDCSFLTTICMIDVDYDIELASDEKENSCYYSLVSNETLAELGFSTDLLATCFDDEIIYMNEMTKDLARKILKDKSISPIYQYKLSLERKGKKVLFTKAFMEALINFGLDLEEGFEGILKTFKQIAQGQNINGKTIAFTEEDLANLSIGTYLPDLEDEYEEYDPRVKKNKKEIAKTDVLKVDLENRTINGKTLTAVVELIKENIKGQDEQVFAVVSAFFKHTFNRYKNFNKFEFSQLKENVLLIGSTGVGKTAIVENLARIFNLPYKREIAPRYSKAGYVGESVDSMLKDLVEVTKGDIEKAQNGILFIDEVDKIRASGDKVDMGLGVQDELLTLIEGDIRTIRPNAFDGEARTRPYDFDTTNLFVFASGAFHGLDEITKRRIKKEKSSTVGFKTTDTKKEIIETTTPEDLVEYGMDLQFVGRLPNIVNLNILGEDTLYEIVNSPNGYVNLNKKSYRMDGVEIVMSEGFKRNLAKKSFLDKKGARSIKTIFSKVKNEIDKNLQYDDYEQVILNDDSLDDYKNIVYVKRKK